jgi:drug/metabolite transporter (DMT)-like permease
LNSRLRAILSVLSILFLSALMGVLAKLALIEVPAFTFAWLQILSGGVFLTVYTLVFNRAHLKLELAPREWAAVVFIGLSNFSLVRILMMMSLERLPATTHTFLGSSVGLVTMAMSIVFLAERPGRLQVLGGVLAIFGIWLFFPEIPAPQEMLGVFYLALVVLGLAASNNVTRWLVTRRGDSLPSSVLSTLAMWIGGIPVVLAGLTFDWPPEVGGLQNGLIIFANGVIGIALVLTVFNSILKTLRSFEASILAGSGLIWTVILAVPILGERLDSIQISAIFVMLLGLFLAQRRPATAGESSNPVDGH